MSKTEWTVVIILILLIPVLTQGLRPVRAAGETYSLTATPGRVVEAYPAGIHIVLTVSNTQTGPYSFTWTVTNPAGTTNSIPMNTLSTGGSWNETGDYPSSFNGTSLDLVGTYSINIAEVTPSVITSVKSASFQVGLTNSPTYQRTSIVAITGTGYVAGENVTIQVLRGTTPASGFPTWRNAAGGALSFSWQTAPNTPLGTYNVTLSGKTTPTKTPPDSQLFTVYATNATINTVSAKQGTVSRTQETELKFNATYLTGLPATTGSAQVILTEPNSATSHILTAVYDSTESSFTCYYNTTLSSPTGLWSASLGPNAFNDGYGNLGPAGSVSTTFAVQPAILSVSDQSFNQSYTFGSIISIISRVQGPSGAIFTQGTVTATISLGGRIVAGPIQLSFDQTRGDWTGSYKVANSDPAGTWSTVVTAQDAYGNSGQTSASFNVSTQGPVQSFISTWLWLIAILAVIGTGFAILILRRNKATHQEVKLDLHAIHRKAEEVKSDDFLQSIQAQLKRRTDMMAAEKKAREEKHD